MYECTRGLEDSVYHNTNSPGTLDIKAGVRTREHDSRREHRMSREPPGYYFGRRVLFPECSCRWPSLERRAVHFAFSHGGAASTGMMLEFLFLRTRLYTARSYYWSEQNETEKPSDEPPTDLEHRPGARADQAHRARMIARSTICYGCFSLITFRFCCLFFDIIALIF